MVFRQLFRVCLARAWVILFVLLAVLGTTVAASLLMPKRYAATTSMVVEFPSNDPVSGSVNYMAGTIASALATQVDIIRSERVLKRAIASANLENDPSMRAEWMARTDGKGAYLGWLASTLLKDLRAEASREGAVITLTYEAHDPELAARIANAISQAYVDVTLDMKTDTARNYGQQFEAQAKQYREELRQAQARLSAFQAQAGITASDERFDMENMRLNELSTQLVQLQSLAVEARSRSDAVGRSRDTLPEVVASPLINGLKSDISRVEQRLEQEGTRLGPNHPQYQATQSELNVLKQRLDAEVGKVAGSLQTGRAITDQREAQLRAAVESQRGRVLALKKQRDQLAVLQREVEAPQRALELLTQRLTQATMESRSRQSNVAIVSSAFAPDKPSRPQPLLNTVIGAFFGLVLGIVAAIALEAVQRPLRSSDDLLEAIGVPVLAVLPPADSRRPQRLIGSTGPSVSPNLRLGNG